VDFAAINPRAEVAYIVIDKRNRERSTSAIFAARDRAAFHAPDSLHARVFPSLASAKTGPFIELMINVIEL
jgi:hypothetical protein